MAAALAVLRPRPRPRILAGHADVLLLVLLGLPTALIDWQIAQVWSWPTGFCLAWMALTGALMALAVARPRLREATTAATALALYAVPVLGGIARWHLVPSPTALIGDGSLQIQIARNVLLKGIDPYGFNYVGTGLERAPWSQPFPNPALHHLDYWPGTILLPLPLQAAWQSIFGWWDERIVLLGAAAGVWILLRKLVPGPAGRMAAVAFFLIPGHSLLAVLGDNDLPMLAFLFAAMLAVGGRKFLAGALLLGLAIATKQTALVAAPLVVAWASAQGVERGRLVRGAALSAAVVLVLCVPFVLWNAGALITDTIAYNLLSGPEAYPIQGLGLSTILLHAGVIHGARDPFPFFLIQAAVTIPLWVAGVRGIMKRRQAADVILWSGVALFGFLYVNRFFQQTYLLLGSELILAGLLARLPSNGEHPRLSRAPDSAAQLS